MTEHLSTTAIITKTYNESTVLQFRNDGWFNMTKAAKAFDKDLSNFMRLPSTVEYMEALSNSVISTELTEAKSGRYHGGTWAHPKLAVLFARWLDTKFSVWCDTVIDDILRGKAEVVITKPETSEIMKMPTSLLEAGELWIATSLGVMPAIPVITPRCPPPTPWTTLSSSVKSTVLEIIPGNRYTPSRGTLAHHRII